MSGHHVQDFDALSGFSISIPATGNTVVLPARNRTYAYFKNTGGVGVSLAVGASAVATYGTGITLAAGEKHEFLSGSNLSYARVTAIAQSGTSTLAVAYPV